MKAVKGRKFEKRGMHGCSPGFNSGLMKNILSKKWNLVVSIE